MEEYKFRIAPVVENFGGRYIVIAGPLEVVEGDWKPVFPVFIQFPTLDAAAGGQIGDYRVLRQLRLSARSASGVFFAGLE